MKLLLRFGNPVKSEIWINKGSGCIEHEFDQVDIIYNDGSENHSISLAELISCWDLNKKWNNPTTRKMKDFMRES